MGKPEVESFISFLLCRLEVMILRLVAHRIPFTVPRTVPPHVIALDENCHHNVPPDNREENLVSAPIVRLIIFPIDLYPRQVSQAPGRSPFSSVSNITTYIRSNNRTRLADHIIQGTAYCPRSHRTGIA